MVNYNIRFTKMKLSHYWNLFGLLVSLTHLANGQVVFDIQGTSCQSHDITLGCTISSFTTDAIWKRGNGSVLVVTCSSAGPCSQVSQNIGGTTYSFQGNTSGIYMSTTLPVSEHGVNWTCTYSSTDFIYQFELGCSVVDSIIEFIKWLWLKITKIIWEFLDFISRVILWWLKYIKGLVAGLQLCMLTGSNGLQLSILTGANGFQFISMMMSIILMAILLCHESYICLSVHILMFILAQSVGVLVFYIIGSIISSCQNASTAEDCGKKDIKKENETSEQDASTAKECGKQDNKKENETSEQDAGTAEECGKKDIKKENETSDQDARTAKGYCKKEICLAYALVLLPIAWLVLLVIVIWPKLKSCINKRLCFCCRKVKENRTTQQPSGDTDHTIPMVKPIESA